MEPPPDIPECGFVGELCPPSVRGKSLLPNNEQWLTNGLI